MFELIANAFNIILYKPLFNALVLLYDYAGHDFGMSIILLTLLIRIILYPIASKTVKSQKALQQLQPKAEELQKRYKDDKEKQAKAILDLYKTEKINPFGGLFLGLVQLPVLIALYRVFWQGLNQSELANLYSFVASPGHIDSFFLGLMDLSRPNFIAAITAGILQFWQTKMLLPKISADKRKASDFSRAMQSQMTYFMPVFTIIILLGLPSALGLYWIVSSFFSIIQQYFLLKKNDNTGGKK